MTRYFVDCSSSSFSRGRYAPRSRTAQFAGEGEKSQGITVEGEKSESNRAKLGRLPIEWLIGPYIPVQESLQPLSSEESKTDLSAADLSR